METKTPARGSFVQVGPLWPALNPAPIPTLKMSFPPGVGITLEPISIWRRYSKGASAVVAGAAMNPPFQADASVYVTRAASLHRQTFPLGQLPPANRPGSVRSRAAIGVEPGLKPGWYHFSSDVTGSSAKSFLVQWELVRNTGSGDPTMLGFAPSVHVLVVVDGWPLRVSLHLSSIFSLPLSDERDLEGCRLKTFSRMGRRRGDYSVSFSRQDGRQKPQKECLSLCPK